MSDHACVSVVVAGFIVGGSALMAWTTVPPIFGSWASVARGQARASASATARTRAKDLRMSIYLPIRASTAASSLRAESASR
jgi:hypothetical protein